MKPFMSTTGCLFLGIFLIGRAPAAERPLRYKPDGTDFVIENGKSFFNRPLYGRKHRLPRRRRGPPRVRISSSRPGGNFRLGFLPPDGGRGLDFRRQSSSPATARERWRTKSGIPSADATLTVTAIPWPPPKDGLSGRLTWQAPPLSLVWAFGGSDGNKGRRNGDTQCGERTARSVLPVHTGSRQRSHV